MQRFLGVLVVLAALLLASSLTLAGSAAVPGDLTLASSSDAGVKGDGPIFGLGLSADGSKVGFNTTSSNLDPADTDLAQDIYVKDLTSGDIVLASTSDTGVKANSSSGFGSLSRDGTRVAFPTSSTNLDAADTDTLPDVYVKDLVSGDLMLASTSDTGVKGNGGSFIGSLSADGTRVAFVSTSTNLDPGDSDSIPDVYVKDLVSGDIKLASTSDSGVKGNGNCFNLSLSADGTKVAFFTTSSNLDPADTDTVQDVYVKNLVTGDITLASTSDTGVKGNGNSFSPSISADGTHVAFPTVSTNLDPADTDSIGDVYVKNLVTGDITLASTSDTGVKGNAGGDSSSTALSADGSRVTFSSGSTNLDPMDTDTVQDVYVKDLGTGDVSLASTSDTGVKGNDASVFASLSADGTSVGFESLATNLDPADTDSLIDAYAKTLGAVDVTQPVITVPANITAAATSPAGATVTYEASANDDVDGPVPVTCSPPSGSIFPIGTTNVTCTATDKSGNSASASFTVHVKGAAEQLADLLTIVIGVGPGTSLADKVKKTQSSFANGDVADACATLAAFVNQVKAQSGKTILPRTATALVVDATRIRTVLGC